MSKKFVNQVETPTTAQEAIESKQKEESIKAMRSEINSLVENQTWICAELPKLYKALPSKWVYRIKGKAGGSVDRYRARHVIKGF